MKKIYVVIYILIGLMVIGISDCQRETHNSIYFEAPISLIGELGTNKVIANDSIELVGTLLAIKLRSNISDIYDMRLFFNGNLLAESDFITNNYELVGIIVYDSGYYYIDIVNIEGEASNYYEFGSISWNIHA